MLIGRSVVFPRVSSLHVRTGIRAGEGPGAGGGAGGAGGAGGGSRFTDDDFEALDKRMGNLFNNMFTARMGKVTKELTADFGTMLKKELEGFKPAKDPEGDPDPGGKGGKNPKGESVELATMRREIENERKAREQSEARAKQSEMRRREMEKGRALDQALAEGGITDPFMRELAIAHFDKRKLVAHQSADDYDDPTLVWNGADGMTTSFESGLKSWLKGPEAARFLPPRNVRGSGSRGGGSPQGGGGADPKAVEADLWQRALDDL
jgi:hypothetical protein